MKHKIMLLLINSLRKHKGDMKIFKEEARSLEIKIYN